MTSLSQLSQHVALVSYGFVAAGCNRRLAFQSNPRSFSKLSLGCSICTVNVFSHLNPVRGVSGIPAALRGHYANEPQLRKGNLHATFNSAPLPRSRHTWPGETSPSRPQPLLVEEMIDRCSSVIRAAFVISWKVLLSFPLMRFDNCHRSAATDCFPPLELFFVVFIPFGAISQIGYGRWRSNWSVLITSFKLAGPIAVPRQNILSNSLRTFIWRPSEVFSIHRHLAEKNWSIFPFPQIKIKFPAWSTLPSLPPSILA